MSVMIKDLVPIRISMDGRLHTTQNTYDYKTDGDMVEEAKQEPVAREDFAGTDLRI